MFRKFAALLALAVTTVIGMAADVPARAELPVATAESLTLDSRADGNVDDGWRRTTDGWERVDDWKRLPSVPHAPSTTEVAIVPGWRFDGHPAALALVQVLATAAALSLLWRPGVSPAS